MRSVWAMAGLAQASTSADANSLFICNSIEPWSSTETAQHPTGLLSAKHAYLKVSGWARRVKRLRARASSVQPESVQQHNGERAASDVTAYLDLGHRHVLRTHRHGDPGVEAPGSERIGRLRFCSVTAIANDVECQAALILVDVL